MRRQPTSYFRHKYSMNTPWTNAYLFCVCLACWGLGYSQSIGFPMQEEVRATPLWNAISPFLPGETGIYLIGFFLMLGSALTVNQTNYTLMLIRERTLLPFLFYAFLTSTNPDLFPLKSTSIAVLCLTLALYQLLASYHDPEARDRAFNSTLLLSMGSLFWVHILWFIPVFWIGMYNFRNLTLRTFVASLLGILTVYWFVLGWCIWQEDLSAFTIPFTYLFQIHLFRIPDVEITGWIQIALVAVLTIVASINILTHEYENNLRTRQYLSFLILMAIWSFGLLFISGQSSDESLMMACVPVSILIAHFFISQQGKHVFWTFHLLIVLSIALAFIRIWNIL